MADGLVGEGNLVSSSSDTITIYIPPNYNLQSYACRELFSAICHYLRNNHGLTGDHNRFLAAELGQPLMDYLFGCCECGVLEGSVIRRNVTVFAKVFTAEGAPDSSVERCWRDYCTLQTEQAAGALFYACESVVGQRRQAHATISKHHNNLKQDYKPDTDLVEGQHPHQLQAYADSSVVTAAKPWIRAAHSDIVDQLDRIFLLSSEARRHHAIFVRKKTLREARIAFFSKHGRGMNPQELAALEDDVTTPTEGELNCGSFHVLDCGACSNPFAELFAKFGSRVELTAVDLQPMAAGVLQCDFLTVPAHPAASGELFPVVSIAQLSRCRFHAIIMSLVLSYLPTPELRMRMVLHCRDFLKDNGVLVLLLAKSIAPRASRSQLLHSWLQGFRNCGFELEQPYRDGKHQAGVKIVLRRTAGSVGQVVSGTADLFMTHQEQLAAAAAA